MDDFTNVIQKDGQIRNRINNLLDRNNRLPYNYQSIIGYDSLIQNVILKEVINIVGITLTDLDIELKMKKAELKKREFQNGK